MQEAAPDGINTRDLSELIMANEYHHGYHHDNSINI